MKPIQGQFESYKKMILEPAGAGEIQTTECRRAFYAGAVAIWGLLLQKVSAGDEVTAEDMNLMRRVQNEIDSYVEDLKKQP